MSDDATPALPVLLDQGIGPQVTLERFRWLVSYPTWNFVMQSFDYSRSYVVGLNTMAVLLQVAETYRHELGESEYDEHRASFYGCALGFLDKLDRWDDYLSLWEHVRRTVPTGRTYSRAALDRRTNEDWRDFLLRDDGDTVSLHFLSVTVHRKALIERKLARLRRGASVGHLMHEPQSALTPDEVKERFEWMVRYRTTGKCDSNPPASRQREERLRRTGKAR